MRIITYPNPFKLNKNPEICELICKYPHFCASDTLLQGLEAEYGRESFGYLRSIDSLIEKIWGEYTQNADNDMLLFLMISQLIREIPDEEMSKAFRFNIAEIVKSIKFLVTMQCDANNFFHAQMSAEQLKLLEIYKKVQNSEYVKTFNELEFTTQDDYRRAVKRTINDEIEYMCSKQKELYEKLEIRFPLKEIKDGRNAILKLIKFLENEKESVSNSISINSKTIKQDLKRAKHLLNLINEEDNQIFEKVIIHGVHRMDPLVYLLVNVLEKLGIEVIFLINYAKNLPNVYKTWKEVYSWCDKEFEYAEEIDLSQGKPLGKALADIIEGKRVSQNLDDSVTIYDNLSSFTDREVSRTFKKANQNLYNMSTQYYAVNNKFSNEILKIYYPEQFKQKPFLAYPIGQFILGIYQMWSFEKKCLLISTNSLSECAVSNLYKDENNVNLLEVIQKTKLYFSDIENVSDYYKRISELDTAISTIEENNSYNGLKNISFFNLSVNEIKCLKKFLEFIDYVANLLFKDNDPVVDFGKHFKNLMEIVSEPAMSKATLSKSEQELIVELNKRFSVYSEGKIKGSIQDVKDALSFYLTVSKQDDHSNWIVRNFEQIDGAVLLRKQTKAKVYHFALLSNANMTGQDYDALSWPLTESMFTWYKNGLDSSVRAVTLGLLERKNFLKFMLFYGLFFTKCNVKMSYVEEENGKDQSPYYLLKILNIKMNRYIVQQYTSFITNDKSSLTSANFNSGRLDKDAKELFSICPYKFFQNKIIKSPIEYSSDYHIKYYLANFMYFLIKEKYGVNACLSEKNIKSEFKVIQKLFPFWDNVVFSDIRKSTKKQLDQESSNVYNSINNHEQYKKRKRNFLIAQWSDELTGKKHMDFNKANIEQLIDEYMNSPRLYPCINELPHEKVCENCNYDEVCLRGYYELHEEGDD